MYKLYTRANTGGVVVEAALIWRVRLSTRSMFRSRTRPTRPSSTSAP
nr:hypothetical protein [Mesorhizobium sp.]